MATESSAASATSASVMTDLAHFIDSAPLIDTHEHLRGEADLLKSPPDVLLDLFGNYVTADLVVAGAAPAAVDRLIDPSDRDLKARFLPVQKAWESCRHTGYGEAVRFIARHFYDLDEISPETLEAAQARAAGLRGPGTRLALLQKAGIDHIQVDNFTWKCEPDASGPDFFLYDISWASFSNGRIDTEALRGETGIEVRDLESLRAAMAALFALYGRVAIAVKSQHAYDRTLRWEERDEDEVARVLGKLLAGDLMTDNERCVLGDWCLARGVELATEYDLPFKIHTGYYAGHSKMPIDRIRPGHLSALLMAFPKARFVLMHIAYPYSEELTALAKHYPNVWVDLCWAWSINPFAAADFVRRFIHAVPANKLFGFGGDSFWPCASVAYSVQARQGLRRSLEAEVADGLMSEREALALAERFMVGNQRECFDIEGTRRAIQEAMAAQRGPSAETSETVQG